MWQMMVGRMKMELHDCAGVVNTRSTWLDTAARLAQRHIARMRA